MHSMLLLLAPVPCTGFVASWDIFGKPAYSYAWTLPENSSSTDGLGQGIAYAVNPTFCENLLPTFSEKSGAFGFEFLVDCKLLRAAINRALATWSENHPNIKFLDVSERCNFDALWKCRGRAAAADCDCGVEFVIDVALNDPKIANRTSSSDERAAYVRQRTGWGQVRSPSGMVREAFMSVEADLFFSNDLCWYLDSTFCSWFHSISKSSGDINMVQTAGTTVIFTVWVIALLGVCFSVCLLSHTQARPSSSCSLEPCPRPADACPSHAQIQTARETRAERLRRRALRMRESFVQASRGVSARRVARVGTRA